MTRGIGRFAAVGALLVALVSPALHAQTPPGWNLVWSDEFDGTSLSNNWEPMLGDGSQYGIPGWGNNEQQWYTSSSQNLFVDGGNLHIVARQQNMGGYNYTSARIRTLNRRDFLYGRFEARMKLPTGQGMWPAFWMLPTNSPYGGWAASGEMDIMEAINVPTTAYGTIHHGGPWPDNQLNGNTLSNGTNYASGFHTFAMEWEPDVIRWFVDGQQYHSVTSSDWFSTSSGNSRAPFNTPFHLLLNVAVGGNFPGPPNGSTQFPQEMLVDWVRAYSRQPVISGACCTGAGNCAVLTEFDCGFEGGNYLGDDTDCNVICPGGGNIQLRLASPLPDLDPVGITLTDPAAGVELYVQARIVDDPTAAGIVTFDGKLIDDFSGSFAAAPLTVLEATGLDFPGLDPLERTGMFPSYRSTIGSNNADPGNGEPFDTRWAFLPLNIEFAGNGEGLDGDWSNIYKFRWSSADPAPRDVDLLVTASFGGYQASTELQQPIPVTSDTLTITIEAGGACDCDTDGSTTVDVLDLLEFLAVWFPLDLAADYDASGTVDVIDLLAFLACWFPATAGDPCP